MRKKDKYREERIRMIVILLKDVKGTGKAGEVVKVSDGYARNMLIPKGFATEASDKNVRNLEKQKALIEEKKAADYEKAKELADKLSEVTVNIVTKSGEGGRLFGSITSKDVSDALNEQHKLYIDKKKFAMDSPIKTIGETEVLIKLYSDVSAMLKVNVANS
jgi:large subunit ribosomal protein L9